MTSGPGRRRYRGSSKRPYLRLALRASLVAGEPGVVDPPDHKHDRGAREKGTTTSRADRRTTTRQLRLLMLRIDRPPVTGPGPNPGRRQRTVGRDRPLLDADAKQGPLLWPMSSRASPIGSRSCSRGATRCIGSPTATGLFDRIEAGHKVHMCRGVDLACQRLDLRGVTNDLELVAEPLHGGTRDRDGALESVDRRVVAEATVARGPVTRQSTAILRAT
jgi:hypothetical protein